MRARRAALAVVAASTVVGWIAPNVACAVDRSWVAAPGTPLNFGAGGNWSGGIVPGATDNAVINNGGIGTIGAAFSGTVNGVGLGTISGATGTVQQTGGTLISSLESYIGGAATSGGGNGTYSISGGTFDVGSGGGTGDLFVGGGGGGAAAAGNGTLAISGSGLVNIRSNLRVGTAGAGVGTLIVSGGTLQTGNTSTIFIGDNSSGFANFSGGVVGTRNMLVGRIPGGGGTVTQSGGEVNITSNLVMFERAPDFVIAPALPCSWTMTGGALNVGNEMYIGAHGTTTFNLSGTGSINVVGTVHIAASAAIADPPEGVGTLNMNGGTINVTGGNAFFVVGDGGKGTFNFSAGAVNTKFYNIGQNFGAIGVVNHTGGSATAQYAMVVGEESRGANIYDLSGGTVTVVGIDETLPGDTNLGSAGGARGTLKVRGTGVANIGGSIRAGGANQFSAGTLDVSGGILNVGANGSGAGKILMGDNGGGTLLISGGLITTDTVTLGQNTAALGVGTQSGGTFIVRSDFAIGEASTRDNAFVISGGSLSIGAGSLGGGLFVGSTGTGSFRLSGAGNVAVGGTINNAPTGVGTVSVGGGNLTANALVNNSNYLQSGGTASVGPVTGTGTSTVSGGSLTTSSIRQGTLSISGGTAAVSPDGSQAGLSVVKSLAITGTGKLDLTNNSLVIDYTDPPTPLADVRADILAGYAAGAWTGNGLTSSAAAAAASTNRRTALGYAEASELLGVGGGTFLNESVDGTAVLVRYTLSGDANLTGTVDIDDFGILAANFNQASQWVRGDFNYSGATDIDDFGLLAANFNASLPAAARAAVPEPALMTAMFALPLLVGRRRR